MVKLLFIPMPRTASTSLIQYFNIKYKNKIKTIEHKYLEYGRNPETFNLDLSQYFIFGFVRNPWNFWVSNYHHQLYNRINNHDKAKEYITKVSFEEFVEDMFNKIKNNELEFWSQSAYYNRLFYIGYKDISDPQLSIEPQGKFIANYIGKYETINKDLQNIEKITKIQMPNMDILPKINKTTHKHYSSYYKTQLKNMITEIEQSIITKYNYKFEEQ